MLHADACIYFFVVPNLSKREAVKDVRGTGSGSELSSLDHNLLSCSFLGRQASTSVADTQRPRQACLVDDLCRRIRVSQKRMMRIGGSVSVHVDVV